MLDLRMKTPMHEITINGLKITYYRRGHGTPLLFLHGGRLNALIFERSLRELSKRYMVIAPDIPGYGASDTPKDVWSCFDYAEFFESFLFKLELRHITLVGYSMGGGIAFNLAAISNRVNRLILVDSSGLHAADTTRTAHNTRRLLFYVRHPSYYSTLAALLSNYRQYIWKHRLDRVHMERIRQACFDTTYDNALQHISMPTLLLWGQDDWVIPITVAYEFQKYIPQATIKTVKANHDWPIYMPLLFDQQVL
jgi:pimeloyl-ACP methyl ester carboxylesterase